MHTLISVVGNLMAETGALFFCAETGAETGALFETGALYLSITIFFSSSLENIFCYQCL